MRKIYIIIFIFICSLNAKVNAQEVDLENIGSRTKAALRKNPFKVSGGLSANAVFYNSNMNSSRIPFTYFLNGNLNLGFYQWSMPISYSFTNQGSNLNYQIPWKFNRISISPKYKWIQAHIGDVNMSFSPYTFNGLMFTGLGLELNPDFPLKVALMGGRLNKAVEEDGNPQTIPAYKRMGYGANLRWKKEKYKIGVIGFYAKDEINSLHIIPDSKNIFPQENLVLSLEANIFIHKNIEIYGNFANSALTNDLRATKFSEKSKNIGVLFLNENSSTEVFHAYNAGVNFNLKNTSLGIRYERIDPGYRTLGAYYFNNDLENITLNTNFNLFENRLVLSTSLGRQIDNLKQQKLKRTSRWVGSVNANLKVSEKLTISANYSNFTMFTNKQLNQFTNINRNPLQLQQPKDSIDFKQISQNMNVNINYVISNKEELTQNLNLNYSLNDMVNKENDIVRKGGISRFHNAVASYSLGFPKRKMSIALSGNYTHTYAASQISTIWGPSITLNKSFFGDKLQSSFGASYNQSTAVSSNVKVTNLRLGASYSPWKNHNLTMNIIQMLRNTHHQKEIVNTNEMTATIGYGYRF